jgi:hypothetical protein
MKSHSAASTVVLRLTVLDESIRNQPAVRSAQPSPQDALGVGESMRREAKTRKRDHAVAAPLRKPVVAGDDASIVLVAIDDELIGSQRQRPARRERSRRARSFSANRAAYLRWSGRRRSSRRVRAARRTIPA